MEPLKNAMRIEQLNMQYEFPRQERIRGMTTYVSHSLRGEFRQACVFHEKGESRQTCINNHMLAQKSYLATLHTYIFFSKHNQKENRKIPAHRPCTLAHVIIEE